MSISALDYHAHGARGGALDVARHFAESDPADSAEKTARHRPDGEDGEVAMLLGFVVGGERNADAAWFDPHPKDAAANIKGYVAFWKGVTVSE